MKVLMINGSANVQGCTYTALKEIEKELNAKYRNGNSFTW